MNTAVSWILYSLAANGCIMMVEYLNRGARGPWISVLPYTIAFIVVAQYCLFRSFNGASHWLLASAMFSIGNSLARIVVVRFFAGGEIGNWWLVNLGIGAMLAGSFLVKGGLK